MCAGMNKEWEGHLDRIIKALGKHGCTPFVVLFHLLLHGIMTDKTHLRLHKSAQGASSCRLRQNQSKASQLIVRCVAISFGSLF